MCMQVYDSGQSHCKQDQHYTQAVSLSCIHPNCDGWPALSTGRRDSERARSKAALACIAYTFPIPPWPFSAVTIASLKAEYCECTVGRCSSKVQVDAVGKMSPDP